MDTDFKFGGGLHESLIHPVILAFMIVAAILTLFLPRKFAFVPVLFVGLLSPRGQQLVLGGVHFGVIRMVILVAIVRLIKDRMVSGRLLKQGLVTIDKIVIAWAAVRATAFVLLYRETGAVVNQVAFLLDTYGTYFLFRYSLQEERDIIRMGKVLAVIAAILGVFMVNEHLSGTNVFGYLGTVSIRPWIRNGAIRSQAGFTNSISAGAFGATLLPLFFWLWKSGKALIAGMLGLAAAVMITMTSLASTPIVAMLAGIGALLLWPIRRELRLVRWGLVFAALVLMIVMKAPVWFLIARADMIGGSNGYDRAMLVDNFVRHFPDWWLFGVNDNSSWGYDMWDQCNQFVREGEEGGLATLVLFITLLTRCFGDIGRARKRSTGTPRAEWLVWSLGAILLSHIVTFFGLSYFDQITLWWYGALAIIAAATQAEFGSGDIQTRQPIRLGMNSSPELAVR